MPLDENLQNQLQGIIASVSTQVTAASSQVLNSEMSLAFGSFADSLTQSGTVAVAEPSVILSSTLSDAALGSVSVIINSSTAAALAAQMMGAEPAAELDDAQKEAVNSLITQGFTSANSQLPALQAEGLQLSAFELTVLDPANADSLNITAPTGEMTAIKLTLGLATGLSSEITVEISTDLATALASAFEASPATESTATDSSNADRDSSVSGTDFAEIKDSQDPSEVNEGKNLNLLMDIRMGMIVELGRAEMHLKDILKLTKGSIIELDRLSGEPVDLFVNNKLIARGEVVVIDDNFGLRITQLAGTKSPHIEDLGLLTVGE